MPTSKVANSLEQRFLASLQVAAADIKTEFRHVRAQAYSQPFGQATDSPGHAMGLSCFFPQAPDDQPDEVVLEIVLGGAWNPVPSIEVNVIWGYPGQVEADLFPVPVPLSDAVIQQIECELPRLLAVLRSAVQRGRPVGNR